jgi:hypothetical protein
MELNTSNEVTVKEQSIWWKTKGTFGAFPAKKIECFLQITLLQLRCYCLFRLSMIIPVHFCKIRFPLWGKKEGGIPKLWTEKEEEACSLSTVSTTKHNHLLMVRMLPSSGKSWGSCEAMKTTRNPTPPYNTRACMCSCRYDRTADTYPTYLY